ncbi:unnamed protein product, partial [Linum tenue]
GDSEPRGLFSPRHLLKSRTRSQEHPSRVHRELRSRDLGEPPDRVQSSRVGLGRLELWIWFRELKWNRVSEQGGSVYCHWMECALTAINVDLAPNVNVPEQPVQPQPEQPGNVEELEAQPPHTSERLADRLFDCLLDWNIDGPELTLMRSPFAHED